MSFLYYKMKLKNNFRVVGKTLQNVINVIHKSYERRDISYLEMMKMLDRITDNWNTLKDVHIEEIRFLLSKTNNIVQTPLEYSIILNKIISNTDDNNIFYII